MNRDISEAVERVERRLALPGGTTMTVSTLEALVRKDDLRTLLDAATKATALQARVDELEGAVAAIGRLAYTKPDRTLGECADDLGRVDDFCRATLARKDS